MGLPSCTSAVWRRAYRESVALGAVCCCLLRREKAGAKEEEGKTGAECHHFRPGKPEVPVRTLPRTSRKMQYERSLEESEKCSSLADDRASFFLLE
ncbi:hypothetical protein HPB47_012774 [Ixodes persulcatus]|uniref:Uncharacterized protein n=1 Tax=Ixodes persulcatus TaxID=34615 RepID=A0AC60NSI5_IXOPE|nr:hypothetical protein HPB47_012774 [Ixodes persulcatus]